MIPVDQEISDAVNGDCFPACVASVLELPLADVPGFVRGNADDWFEQFAAWAVGRGYAAAYVPNDPPIAPRGYAIGVCDYHEFQGITVGHAIVALDGRPVHCPHPSRAGLGKSVRFWALLMPLGQPVTVEAA